MVDLEAFIRVLSAILIGLFVISQVGYFVPNLLIWGILHRVRSRYVRRREPSEYPPVHVLIPAYKEKQDLLEGTITNVLESEYPTDKLEVYIIYEADDDILGAYIDELNVNLVKVDEESDIWDWVSVHWGSGIERNKARALDYAIYTIDMDPEDVVAVFDSDTRFPTSLIPYGVAGLESFDITQSKQTVGNIDDGLLPLLESMGMSAWCDFIYAKTYDEPYQLLGKGYFMKQSTVQSLVGWDPGDPTEDMALGVSAAEKGLQLGVLDTYVQDICPSSFSTWITQKRRWVGGPYRMLFKHDLNLRESIGFQSYTLSNQTIAVTNLIGIPSGAYMFSLFIFGKAPQLPLIVDLMIVFNIISWIYYSVLSIYAAKRAVPIERVGKVKYWLLSNPLTQVFYAALWSFPILLALYDVFVAKQAEFEVTPKE